MEQLPPSPPPLEAEDSTQKLSPAFWAVASRCLAAFFLGFIMGSGLYGEMLSAFALP